MLLPDRLQIFLNRDYGHPFDDYKNEKKKKINRDHIEQTLQLHTHMKWINSKKKKKKKNKQTYPFSGIPLVSIFYQQQRLRWFYTL